ncbi:MAG: phosphate signaling complex protein PhoU [Dehalobacter sp. 4CP]|nr:phosphate signaling complex protein PhoU [Dehalobacter sp. 4CP]
MMTNLTGRKEFDADLLSIEQNLLKLGSLAEDAIGNSIWALQKQDDALALQVIEGDDVLDSLTQEINEQALRIIARYQPVALDLRTISSIIHMATDIERMGDLGSGVAKVARKICSEPLIKPLIDIPRMGELIREMTDMALKAFMNRDAELARKVCAMDDEVDDLDRQIFRELLMLMMQNPRNIEQATHLILISRNLERAGDHVTNLCEHIVYMTTGSFIKAGDFRRPHEGKGC